MEQSSTKKKNGKREERDFERKERKMRRK